jgi:ADP-ribose pyrophosphatase
MTAVASWTVLDSQLSFADPWLRVRSDRVCTAEGDVFGPYHVIEYPDWTTIVPLVEGSLRLLLVGEYRHGVGAILAGLPSGLVDPADGTVPEEAASTAARRELQEETGYAGGRLDHLAALHPNPSNQSNTAYCYLASGLSRETQPEHGGIGEAQELVEADFVETLAAVRDGLLPVHAIHAAALWSAAARIAGDKTTRFGPLPGRLRCFLAGEASDPAYQAPSAATTVGG